MVFIFNALGNYILGVLILSLFLAFTFLLRFSARKRKINQPSIDDV